MKKTILFVLVVALFGVFAGGCASGEPAAEPKKEAAKPAEGK